jgi:hypothetical protein
MTVVHPASKISVALLALAPFLAGCSDEGPATGPAPSIPAPSLVSPPSGSTVDAQPMLTLQNVTPSDGSIPTYTFQVSVSDAYSPIAAQQSGVAQGASGQTTWQVTTALPEGTYFWRARADVGATPGPFSQNDRFTTTAPSIGGGTVLIQDALTNSMSIGRVNGGEFTAEGWRINHLHEYIRYEIPPTSNGFFEFHALGLRGRNYHSQAYMLFSMWDPSSGEFRANPYRVNVQKLDTHHNPPYVRLRFIADGDERNAGFSKLDWDPSHRYRFRLEWGPSEDLNEARFYIDGAEVMSVLYRPEYLPRTHWVELGVNEERTESLIGAIYSNVRIGRR